MGRQKYKVGEGDGEIARINRARLVSGEGGGRSKLNLNHKLLKYVRKIKF